MTTTMTSTTLRLSPMVSNYSSRSVRGLFSRFAVWQKNSAGIGAGSSPPQAGGNGPARIKPTKTEEKRMVELSEGLTVTMAEYLDYVTVEAVAAGQSEPYWLFPGRASGLVTEADERWHRDLFKQTLHAAELPGFVPYDLRHTTASILLSNSKTPAPLLYVSRLMGHKKPTTTLTHYAKWIPSGEMRFVNVLDSVLPKLGTKTWHQVDRIAKDSAEVVEKFGGPCRGRTYGPLIKSQLLYQLS
jgi:integrase-like protein